jgi:hypothetical protein
LTQSQNNLVIAWFFYFDGVEMKDPVMGAALKQGIQAVSAMQGVGSFGDITTQTGNERITFLVICFALHLVQQLLF